jgi:hypothetical protein
MEIDYKELFKNCTLFSTSIIKVDGYLCFTKMPENLLNYCNIQDSNFYMIHINYLTENKMIQNLLNSNNKVKTQLAIKM